MPVAGAVSAPPQREAGASRVPVGLREKEADKSNSPNCSLDRDVQAKLASVGSDLENDLRAWIERLTGESFSDKSFGKSLKNGILLCQYVIFYFVVMKKMLIMYTGWPIRLGLEFVLKFRNPLLLLYKWYYTINYIIIACLFF